jgi:hypothetical protein
MSAGRADLHQLVREVRSSAGWPILNACGSSRSAVSPRGMGRGEIEAHCFSELCNLANLDLRLACYDLTSTYFERDAQISSRFPQDLRLQPRPSG